MAKENIREKLNILRDKGITIYSVSRLNNYNDCQYGYYRSYIFKNTCLDCGHVHDEIVTKCEKCGCTKIVCNRGKEGCYANLGSKMHDHLQNIHEGTETVEDMRNTFDDDVLTTTLFMSFPSDKIQESWTKDMRNFVDNFEPLQYPKVEAERGFVVPFGNVWMQGFIDIIAHNEDGSVDIIDWKTSSEFKGDKLKKAGRQLLIYKKALEDTGIKVNRVGWYMLKYYFVCYDGGKRKQANRGQWVKSIKGLLNTQLKKIGCKDIESMIELAIERNNLDNMPQQVQDRFTLEPCMLWYDVTKELEEETEEYILNTVSAIEGMDLDDVNSFGFKNIYKEGTFFCQELCSHCDKCPQFQDDRDDE